ncbi:MAG: trans-sulfuration enzyme family protein [Planctomycetaceae bacterium]
MPQRNYGCRGAPGAPSGPLAPDLTRATTFALSSAEQVRAVGAGEEAGEFYPRYSHPAGRAFESRVAALEGADGAVAFASGMAAIHGIFFGLLKGGEAIACSRDLYGGVAAMLRDDLPRFGVTVRRFDPFDPADLARALAGGARLVHVETPVNPTCRVVDLAATAAATRKAGALLSVDATFLPPPFQRPLEHGADLVMHSATKYLGGHSDVLAGVVSGRLELCDRLEPFRRRTGATLGPDSAWLLLRSLATLEMRLEAAAANAGRLAAFLEGIRREGGGVRKVHYAGLPDHPDHAVALRQQKSFGAMLGLEVRGGLTGAVRVYDRLRHFARAVSLGGRESLAALPLHTSHSLASKEDRERSGIDDGFIRLSVGVEPYNALEADLRQALGG